MFVKMLIRAGRVPIFQQQVGWGTRLIRAGAKIIGKSWDFVPIGLTSYPELLKTEK